MSNKNLETLVNLVNTNQYNAAQLALDSIDFFANLHDGEVDVFDATNPFVYALSHSSASAVANAQQLDAIHRQLYPVLARTNEDLNRHRSGQDDYGRFSLPATTTIHYLTDLASILKYAVLDSGSSVKKLVIPEETVFEVGGIPFGIHYPITIKVFDNDTLSILLDTSGGINPLYSPETNEIEHVYRSNQFDSDGESTAVTGDRQELLDLAIPVHQFARKNYVEPVNSNVGFTREYPFTDKYMYTRVFTGSDANGWRELETTHSGEIYDALSTNTPTAVITVEDETLKVRIPQIFFTTGAMGANVKVVVYTTLGEVSFSLKDYLTEQYAVIFSDTNPDTKTYSAPMRSLAVSAAYSKELCVGGSNGLTFEESRDLIIYNANLARTPVTSEQLDLAMRGLGYQLMVYKDYLTEKLYLATRGLTPLTIGEVPITPTVGLNSLTANPESLVTLDTVVDNRTQITLLPNTLYKLINGRVVVVSDAERIEMDNMTNTELLVRLSEATYVFSPFYYVLDIEDDYFEYRAYNLDYPEFSSKFFINSHANTSEYISTSKVNIEKVDNGWEVLVETTGSGGIQEAFDGDVIAQLSFQGRFDTVYSGVNGTLVERTEDGNFIFKFLLETNYNIDADNYIQLTNFKAGENDLLPKDAVFNPVFRLSYATSLVGSSVLDSEIVETIIPSDHHVLTVENVHLKLGTGLDKLFLKSRPVTSEKQVKRHTTDILAYWEADVWETDGSGSLKLYENPKYPDESSIPYIGKKLYTAGEPVLDTEGNPTYKQRTGDPVIVDGEPVYLTGRSLQYFIELFLLDARFRYATETNSMSLISDIVENVEYYLENDIAPWEAKVLGGTEMVFYPKRTMGEVSVTVSENRTLTIDAQQNLVFRVYLTETAFKDTKTVNLVERTIREISSSMLSKVSVNKDEIQEAIKTAVGGDTIISVAMEGLGGSLNLDRFTLTNANESVSVAVNLETQSDGSLKLVDGITVIPYSSSELVQS